MPLAVQPFDLSGYDMVISSNHAIAKGVLTGPKHVHVGNVHSPIRYAWDLQGQYLRNSGMERCLKSMYALLVLYKRGLWNVGFSNGVDLFLANSSYIARRIRKAYQRRAVVVPPPVAVEEFTLGEGCRDGFLVASRFVPYKRIELIVAAFHEMPQRQLTVVGGGDSAPLVKKAAAGASNITLHDPVHHAELIKLMHSAKAMVFSAEEDFGITMVEAQACGNPVIAYEEVGARYIFGASGRDTATGVLFAEQSVAAIVAAVQEFERREASFSAADCRASAMRFSQPVSRQRFMSEVNQAIVAAKRLAKPWVTILREEVAAG
jgi:glycosyltransferase involved in cell wall biosynthesis